MPLRRVPDTLGREASWKIVSTLSGLLGAVVARKLIGLAWSTLRGDDGSSPVLDPADRRFSWKDAMAWAVTAGIGVGVARLIGARLAVAGWEATTGTIPPGVEQPADV